MTDLALEMSSSRRTGNGVAAYVRARALGRKLAKSDGAAAKAAEAAERIVVVLDSSASADLVKACRSAAECAGSVLVMSLGHPQSEAQDAAIREAIEEAWNLKVRFEAILVPSRRAIGPYLMPGDALL